MTQQKMDPQDTLDVESGDLELAWEPVPADPRKRMDIAAKSLVIDQNLQRPVDRARVERMAANWDWRLVETITVAKAGRYYKVIEGQYRTLAAQLRDPEMILPCIVLEKVDDAEQANLAMTISTNRKPMVAVDRYKQRMSAGDPAAIAAQLMLEKYDLRIGASVSSRTILAAQAIMQIVDEYGDDLDMRVDVLDRVLATLVGAYRDGESSAKERWRAPLITGLARLVSTNYDVFEYEDMATRMAEHPAVYWFNLSKSTREKRPEEIVAMALRDAYNRGKRASRRIV